MRNSTERGNAPDGYFFDGTDGFFDPDSPKADSPETGPLATDSFEAGSFALEPSATDSLAAGSFEKYPDDCTEKKSRKHGRKADFGHGEDHGHGGDSGRNNKTSRFTALKIISGLAAAVFVLFGLKLYRDTVEEKERLAAELAQSRMELSIRTFAETVRQERQEKQETELRDTAENRAALKAAYLARDSVELTALVNPWNRIAEDCEPRLTELGDGMLLDERAAGALEEMLKDCRAAGGAPCPISGYRTQEYQQELFDSKVQRLIASGYTAETAPAEAAESVAVPGTSEHQLGLAMDIVDEYYPELDYAQEWTGTQQWLIRHCAEYGFILRYPSDSSEITGIIFEPWHYRYVGKTLAAEITASGLTLEEYLAVNRAE